MIEVATKQDIERIEQLMFEMMADMAGKVTAKTWISKREAAEYLDCHLNTITIILSENPHLRKKVKGRVYLNRHLLDQLEK